MKTLPPGACAVPFTSLILEPNGGVSVCRMKGLKHSVGDLRTQTLEEIWNGPEIRAWRAEFLSEAPVTCRTEIRHRRCQKTNPMADFACEVPASELQAGPPLRLGLNLNGQCNLRCPMCRVWNMGNGFYRDPRIWGQIEKLLPRIREIEMLGGEPFIQKDTYRLMDLVSSVNPGCRWYITTNANWKLTDFVRRKLDRIASCRLLISMDSLIPEVYGGIRVGGDFRKFLRNLDDLADYQRERRAEGRTGFELATNSTIQRTNWREIPELRRFAERIGLFPTFTFLYEPRELSLLSEPDSEREGILEHLVSRLSVEDLLRSRSVLVPLLESVAPLVRAAMVSGIYEKLGAKGWLQEG